ncbi:MAG: hypothetical protein QXI58_00585 [Candidatus Micrarchaeia archaeon]
MLIDFKLFISGVEIPISESITLSFGVNRPATLSFNVPLKSYDTFLEKYLPRSLVSLFFSFDKKDYYLLYEGEIATCGFVYTPTARAFGFNCSCFINYLDTIKLHFVDLTRPYIKELATQTEPIIRTSIFKTANQVLVGLLSNLNEKIILKKFIDWILEHNVPFYTNRIKKLKLKERSIDLISQKALKLFEKIKKSEWEAIISNQNQAFVADMTLLQIFVYLLSLFLSEFVSGFPKAISEFRHNFCFIKPIEIFLPVPISNILLSDKWGIVSFRVLKNLLKPTRAYINILTEIATYQTVLFPEELDKKYQELKQKIESGEKNKLIQQKIDQLITKEEELYGIIPRYYERQSSTIFYNINKDLAMTLLRHQFEFERKMVDFEIVCDFYPFIIPGFPIILVLENTIYLGKVEACIHQIAFAGRAQTIIKGHYLLSEELSEELSEQKGEIKRYEPLLPIDKKELEQKFKIPFIDVNEIDYKTVVDKNAEFMTSKFKDFFIKLDNYIELYDLTSEKSTIIPELQILGTQDKDSPFYYKNANLILELVKKNII